MRFLGVDFGQRRIGLALSDASGSLARPWRTMSAASSLKGSAAALAAMLSSESDEELSELGGVVIGLPTRLNGTENAQTAPAREFARLVHGATGLPVHLQDERLSSYEAEQRLATRERDWRRRKAKLDAAAAAVILQDFLDARPGAQ